MSGMTGLTDALQHLEKGDWEAAHVIVQDDGSAHGSWAHGIVHIMEGDLDNARYWYRRAERTFPEPPDASAEIAALKAALDD